MLSACLERPFRYPAADLYGNPSFRWRAAYQQTLTALLEDVRVFRVAQHVRGAHPAAVHLIEVLILRAPVRHAFVEGRVPCCDNQLSGLSIATSAYVNLTASRMCPTTRW